MKVNFKSTAEVLTVSSKASHYFTNIKFGQVAGDEEGSLKQVEFDLREDVDWSDYKCPMTLDNEYDWFRFHELVFQHLIDPNSGTIEKGPILFPPAE